MLSLNYIVYVGKAYFKTKQVAILQSFFCQIFLHANRNHMLYLNEVYISGDFLFLQRKHKEALKLMYRSGFYITTNDYPDFGSGRDGDAIKTRLSVFHTKSLPKKDLSVSSKFSLLQ